MNPFKHIENNTTDTYRLTIKTKNMPAFYYSIADIFLLNNNKNKPVREKKAPTLESHPPTHTHTRRPLLWGAHVLWF